VPDFRAFFASTEKFPARVTLSREGRNWGIPEVFSAKVFSATKRRQNKEKGQKKKTF